MVSVLDIGLGVLLLLFLVRGLLRGMINEVAGLVGIFLGLILAGRFYPKLAPQFAAVIENSRWAAGASYAVIFFVALILVGLCAALARRFLKPALAPWLDNVMGAAVGFLKGALVCAVVVALMQRFAGDSPFLKNSILAEHLNVFVGFIYSLIPAFLESGSSLT